ncbi:glycosyltransferase family 4 protein [Vitreimonas sp.]|uniref:glycosyltransferase family 4 protein n=1 Tax=Vitreimonas sp. TaxID=3069702 RepID=UPI002ED79E22
MNRPKLLFVVTEDWFFRSHFLPLARRAVEDGYECVVAARDTGALADQPHIRLIDLPFSRRSLRPWDVGRQIAALRTIIARERPEVVHAIALKPIALLALARIRGPGRVFAVTGRGYLSVGRAPWTRLVSWRLRRMLRRELREPRSVLLVENRADSDWVAGTTPLGEDHVVLIPGAGVDPTAFTPVPPPERGSVIIGLVARLIWSKGVDLAVEALRALRAEGMDVVLRIAGARDPQNPEAVSGEELARWADLEGVEFVGRIDDVNAFWAQAHIACLPSRGGEGLPRSLLEAAACGRPIVTSDVPGCADFVAHGEMGVVVMRENVQGLVDAFRKLVLDADLRQRMGSAARQRVVKGYTEVHAGAQASEAWRSAQRPS